MHPSHYLYRACLLVHEIRRLLPSLPIRALCDLVLVSPVLRKFINTSRAARRSPVTNARLSVKSKKLLARNVLIDLTERDLMSE